jgi:hypothetical protein
LTINGRRKIRHCSTEPTAYITRNLRGLSIYCFRCGFKDFVHTGEAALKDLVASRSAAIQHLQSIRGLPADSVALTDAPEAAIVWLIAGGLLPEKAETVHGIKWHPTSNRLLIPIYDRKHNTTGVLARAVGGEKPKYRMVQGSPTLYFPTIPRRPLIVVVEDVLSSIALAKAGYDSAAVLGTSISGEDAYALTRNVDTVVSFMDPDKAGVAGAAQLRKRLGLYPVTVVMATAHKDPKYLSRAALKESIDEALRR